MAKIVLMILLVVGCLVSPLSAEKTKTKNCHSPSVLTHWDAMVSKSPGDMELQTLHALWIGLCVKVDREEIPYDEAWGIFERARSAMILRREKENAKRKEEVVL